MLSGASSFNHPIEAWDLSKVTDTRYTTQTTRPTTTTTIAAATHRAEP